MLPFAVLAVLKKALKRQEKRNTPMTQERRKQGRNSKWSFAVTVGMANDQEHLLITDRCE